LKGFFANIIIFKKKLDKYFENSTRHTTRAITVLKIEGNGAYPEAEHIHDLSSLESLLGTLFLTKFSLKIWKGFWYPRGALEDGRRLEE
jgi:hypothetical protein